MGVSLAGLRDLLREYERTRYPNDRRLDLHGEGPLTARERALHWIRSRAHEEPGQELLLIVQRGGIPGMAPGPVEVEVRQLLDELQGRLIEWWQPFAPGSLALRIAALPRMDGRRVPVSVPVGDGRTEETAGSAWPEAREDIPGDLLDLATLATQRRLDREGLSARIFDVVLREVWIEAQALAMDRRIGFAEALEMVREDEIRRSGED